MIFSGVCGAQPEGLMSLTQILDNVLAADRGELNGVNLGDLYFLQKQSADSSFIYGLAKVVVVRQESCALEVIQKYNQVQLVIGDVLVNVNLKRHDVESLLNEKALNKFTDQFNKYKTDYYLEGQAKANEDYGGSGLFACGILVGFGTGMIGWGIGHAIIGSTKVSVPEPYLKELSVMDQKYYTYGYSNEIKSKRKSHFTSGAIIGILAVLVVLASSNDILNQR